MIEPGWYLFKRCDLGENQVTFIANITQCDDVVHYTPLLFIHGRGDTTELRIGKKILFDLIFDIRPIEYNGTKKEDYPELYL